MKLSRFKFFAYTNPGLELCMQNELSHFIKDARITNIFGRKGVEFRADVSEMTRILLKTRTIQSLNIQIGHPFHASNKNAIEQNLQNINWTSFFNFKKNNYIFPSPIAKSTFSEIYHEKMLKEIFTNTVAEIFKFEDYEKLYEQKKAKKPVLKKKDEKSFFSTKESIGKNEIVEFLNTSSEIVHNKTIEFKTPFYLNLYKNKLSLSMSVFNAEMIKSGYKTFVGWGSVKESIVASFLIGTKLKEQFLNKKEIKIFDPFCGSGTFLIESLVQTIDAPIRFEEIETFDFWDWEFIKGFEKDLKTQITSLLDVDSLKPELNVTLIGTDISKSQLSNAVLNFKQLQNSRLLEKVEKIESGFFSEMKNEVKKANFPYFNFGDKILLINCDFEKLPFDKNHFQDFILMTNIPFGEQSRNSDTDEIYRKFDSFLEKNHDSFESIYIMNRANVENDRNYCKRSKFGWTPIIEFSNGGFEMAFFKFEKFKKLKPKQTVTVETIKKRQQRSKKVIRTVYDVSTYHKLKPNSKKTRDILNVVKKKANNNFLERKKKYENAKQASFESRLLSAESKKSKQILGDVRNLIGDDNFKELKKKIESK